MVKIQRGKSPNLKDKQIEGTGLLNEGYGTPEPTVPEHSR
jgi:hypothetical protein